MRKLFFHLSAASALAASALAGDVVAVKAGTIHPGGGAPAIEDGVVIAEDGKIVALGAAGQVDVPAGAEVIDYGASAVIAPGFVAADSAFVSTTPSAHADPRFWRSIVRPHRASSARRKHHHDVPAARADARSPARAPSKAGGERAGDVACGSCARARGARDQPRGAIHAGLLGTAAPRLDVSLGAEASQLPKTTTGAIRLEELSRSQAGTTFTPSTGP